MEPTFKQTLIGDTLPLGPELPAYNAQLAAPVNVNSVPLVLASAFPLGSSLIESL